MRGILNKLHNIYSNFIFNRYINKEGKITEEYLKHSKINTVVNELINGITVNKVGAMVYLYRENKKRCSPGELKNKIKYWNKDIKTTDTFHISRYGLYKINDSDEEYIKDTN